MVYDMFAQQVKDTDKGALLYDMYCYRIGRGFVQDMWFSHFLNMS